MNKPEIQIYKDLDSLKVDPRFERVFGWIQSSLATYRRDSDLVLEGNALFRSQGKCIILQELVDAIQTTGDNLERVAANRGDD